MYHQQSNEEAEEKKEVKTQLQFGEIIQPILDIFHIWGLGQKKGITKTRKKSPNPN